MSVGDIKAASQCLAPTPDVENGTSASNHDQDLCNFYNVLHRYITDFGVSHIEQQDIQAAVEEVVGKFADIAAAIEPMYKAKSIHGVGSFYEKTKILKLDEFDFLYVIDELSDEAKVEIEKVFTNDVLGLAVKAKDEQYFKTSKWLVNNVDSGSSYLGMLNFLPAKAVLYNQNPQQTFSDVMSKASYTVRSQALSCSKSTGTLTLLGQENKSGPNIELWMEWKPKHGDTFVIKSDITPVIRVHKVEELVTEEHCRYPAYLAELYGLGSYFVMPSKVRHMGIPYTFSPTFTETERDLMADLSPSHKMTYQCLKFLLLDIYTRRNLLYFDLLMYTKPWVFPDLQFQEILKKLDYLTCKSFLSSFCLKVSILQHCIDCKRQERPALCGLEIINTLLECTKQENPCLNGLFIKQDNLFWKLTRPENSTDFNMLVRVLEMLKAFHEKLVNGQNCDIVDSSVCKFRTMFSLLIQISEENGLEAEDSLLEFNPSKFSTSSIYNAYRFTKETNSILEDTTMDPDKQKILLDSANVFYNFDMPAAHSTVASNVIEDSLEELEEKLAVYNRADKTDAVERSGDGLEDNVVDQTDNSVTVIYSRL